MDHRFSRRFLLQATVGTALSGCSRPSPDRPRSRPPAGIAPKATEVFVLGGIHQQHEAAKLYTYQRVGEVYRHLNPDVLCVEALPQYVADRTFRKTPFDFTRAMIPLALEDGIPIVGIDWWDDARGSAWQDLQRRAFVDPQLRAEVALLGGMFELLRAYFQARDFAEIHAPAITELWRAKSHLKHTVLAARPDFREIVTFERDRNENMARATLEAARQHPGERVLLAVGIDHKPPLETLLHEEGLRVLQVDDVMQTWWR